MEHTTNVIMKKVHEFISEFIGDFRVLQRDGFYTVADDVTADTKICELECTECENEQLSTGRLIKQIYTIDITLTVYGAGCRRSESELERICNTLAAKSAVLGWEWTGDSELFDRTHKVPYGSLGITFDLPLRGTVEKNKTQIPCSSVLITFRVPLLDVYGEDY